MLASFALLVALAAAPTDSVIKRGAPVPEGAPIPLAEVLQDPARYAKGEPILISGVVERNCTAKGCWMQLAPEAGAGGVRVTFKDYGFFIPTDSKGKRVRAIGVFDTKQHSAKHAEHLVAEGATLVRNADGTATEVTFVASGVELSS
ncbi:MAG: DUF4920 domain-containing protein [Gemmatimonadales bacterium]|nr:DUF4920 domain-containing protein [Gemmatimonadales bacterium]